MHYLIYIWNVNVCTSDTKETRTQVVDVTWAYLLLLKAALFEVCPTLLAPASLQCSFDSSPFNPRLLLTACIIQMVKLQYIHYHALTFKLYGSFLRILRISLSASFGAPTVTLSGAPSSATSNASFYYLFMYL